MMLYFLYNFVSDLYVPRLPLSLIEVRFRLFNISLLLHDDPQFSERRMNKHILYTRTRARHDLPTSLIGFAQLSICPPT